MERRLSHSRGSRYTAVVKRGSTPCFAQLHARRDWSAGYGVQQRQQQGSVDSCRPTCMLLRTVPCRQCACRCAVPSATALTVLASDVSPGCLHSDSEGAAAGTPAGSNASSSGSSSSSSTSSVNSPRRLRRVAGQRPRASAHLGAKQQARPRATDPVTHIPEVHGAGAQADQPLPVQASWGLEAHDVGEGPEAQQLPCSGPVPAAPTLPPQGGQQRATGQPAAGEPGQAGAQGSAGAQAAARPQGLEGPAVWEAEYQSALRAAGLSAAQAGQLDRYLEVLLDTNKTLNLTAVREPSEARARHLADSLALLPALDAHLAQPAAATPQPPSAAHSPDSPGSDPGMGLRVIDVGSGAGLPGLVLAVARPGWRLVLLDSLRKRCDFLRLAADKAGLSNVEVVWARAEDAGRDPQLRETFDLAVARAVAETRVLAELCTPFVKPGGMWLAAKGPDPEAEVTAAGPALKALGCRLVAIERVASHGEHGQRTAVVVKKEKATPAKYPRPPGTPNKKPL
ncbi:S-adenosyl-L-methionine-dependent methyltransferase [Haematococcus lacustris]